MPTTRIQTDDHSLHQTLTQNPHHNIFNNRLRKKISKFWITIASCVGPLPPVGDKGPTVKKRHVEDAPSLYGAGAAPVARSVAVFTSCAMK